MREYRRKTKILVMTHYCKGNPHCMCPGCCTIFIGFLQMDHINGGGSKNRVETGKDLIYWLRYHNFPKGFQVLCANCNGLGGKGTGKRCPMHGKPH
jgi:hypothetical protein